MRAEIIIIDIINKKRVHIMYEKDKIYLFTVFIFEYIEQIYLMCTSYFYVPAYCKRGNFERIAFFIP